MTNKKIASQSTDADLMAWRDLAHRREVDDVRSLILLAIEREITLGVYANAWHVEYGRLSYDENGEVDLEVTEGEQVHTGFVELSKPPLESLLDAATVKLDYLHRNEGHFTRITGRMVAGASLDGPVDLIRDNLCGRLTKPGPATTQFKPPGPEHSAKKQEGDDRLIAVLVEMYRREKAKSAPPLYKSETHGLQAKIVADIDKFLANGFANDGLKVSTLKYKISGALKKIEELKKSS